MSDCSSLAQTQLIVNNSSKIWIEWKNTYNIYIWNHYPTCSRVSPVKWVGSESTTLSVHCYNYQGLQAGLGAGTKRSRWWTTAAKDKKTESQYHGNGVPLQKSSLNNKNIIMHMTVFAVCISINCCKRHNDRVSISLGCGWIVEEFNTYLRSKCT